MADMTAKITLEGEDNASPAVKKVADSMEELGAKVKETGEKTTETKSAFERIKEGFEQGFGIAAGVTGFHDLKEAIEATGEAVFGFNATLETDTLPTWRPGAVDEEWFTVQQIAKRLQVAERTVRRWLTDGELKGGNFGGKTGWRIRGRDLDAFIGRRFGKADGQ